MTWSTWTAQSQGTGLVRGSRSSRVEGLYTRTGAYRVTTSSLTMGVEAIQWLFSQRDAHRLHMSSFPQTQWICCKSCMESGMGCPDWHTTLHSLWLQRLLCIYCPGHDGVSGNERADRLASTADVTSGLQLGRAKVLRCSRNFWTWTGQRITALIAERKRSGERQRPIFRPPRSETIRVQPDKHCHCFESNLGETAERRGGESVGLSERCDTILSWN